MTQKVRWLAALALLLAFGAGSVRAEEEEEVAPPVRTSVEYLQTPPLYAPPVAAPRCHGSASCACSAIPCAKDMPADATQYVVTTKIIHASADGDCEEVMSPKVTVLEGQTANVLVQDVQTPKGEHGGVFLAIQVTKQDKRVRLNLDVEESKVCDDAPAGLPNRVTQRVQTETNVTLGKMKRLVFTKHANGSDASWLETTVTALPSEDHAAGSPLDCVSEALGDLIDAAADVATSLFGDDAEVQQAVFTTPVIAAPRDYPVPTTAPCPACRQCVAVEAVKKPVVHIHVDAKDNRTCVEMRDGNKSWKASARQITVVNGDLVLEGDVRCEGSDSSPEFTADNIKVPLLAGVDVKVGE